MAGGNDSTFRSSQDVNIGNPMNIYWDYTGIYGVGDVNNNMYIKTLTLNYDYYGNEFFELNVINDQRISLFHVASGTTYEFTGRGYIQYMRTAEGNQTEGELKKRKKKIKEIDNPRENSREL